MIEHPCEGRDHYPADLYSDGLELAPGVRPPVEGTKIHVYNDEDHYFCSNRCWEKWWFVKQQEDGVDVSQIQLVENGQGWYCMRCKCAILYKDIDNVYLFSPFGPHGQTMKFCCVGHYESFVEEFYNGESSSNSQGVA